MAFVSKGINYLVKLDCVGFIFIFIVSVFMTIFFLQFCSVSRSL